MFCVGVRFSGSKGNAGRGGLVGSVMDKVLVGRELLPRLDWRDRCFSAAALAATPWTAGEVVEYR